MPNSTIKLTANIDRDLYLSVTKKFHHGQITELQRKLFKALNKKIQQGNIMEVIEFIYKNKPLTLGG